MPSNAFYSGQGYSVEAWSSFDNVDPSTPSNSTTSPGGYEGALSNSGEVDLSTPSNSTSSGQGYEGSRSYSGEMDLSTPSNSTTSSGQGYEGSRSYSGEMDLSTPSNSTTSSGQGYEGSRPYSGEMDLSTPSNSMISSSQGHEGVCPSSDDMGPLTHTDYNFSSCQGWTEDWLCSGDVGLLTPSDCAISSGQGYAGALPYPNGVDMSAPTEGSVSTGTESWRTSEDANMSSPTDGSYTSHGDTSRTWTNQDEDYLDAGTAPLSQNLEPWTDTSKLGPWNSNGGLSWALLEMLREPAVPPASIPAPEGRSLVNELHAESLPKYDVYPQVGYHEQHISNTSIREVGNGVASAGPPVHLGDSPQHPYPLTTAHSPGHAHPLNSLEPSTSHGGRSSQVVLAQVSAIYLVPFHEPDNRIGSNVMYGPLPPPVQMATARSRPSQNGSMSEGHTKKRPGRRSRLEPQQRKDARAVRKRGACFACHELNQRCDPTPGEMCRPCLARKNKPRVSQWVLCDFTPWANRWALVLPRHIIGHLQDHEMEKYLASAGIVPLGNTFRVECTWGYGPPLVMEMEEIYTCFRRSSSFRLDTDEGTHEHVKGGLVPLQIGKDADKKFRERYFPSLISRPLEGFPEFFRSETGGSEFQSNLLKVICWLYGTSFGKESPELKRGLELLVLGFFMGQNLYLTPESRWELGGRMHFWTDDPAERYPTPGIALRQLKQRLRPKLEDLTKEVLADIHNLCKQHKKQNWTIAFAVLILFALVCQDLQTSAILGGIWEDKNKEDERNGLPYDYSGAWKCINDMENEVFNVLAGFFNKGYRGFKPLEGDFSEDAKRGLHEDSVAFVENIRRLATEAKAERNLVQGQEREGPIDEIPPRQFAARNVSRLVLKLLPNTGEW
ncbi:hypothetical protein FGG08_006615 [Glutinoglossum americanum]|uniref:Zn(2)-C6 fungal-type domain-containing protein n=1 Tax=Glutinoglossum americanum TaxID=1670608 RepID=A0A9P8HSB1_9PEZI|nr:hypothetical protein FGG08_006615 [Glutinoglossum americanum]